MVLAVRHLPSSDHALARVGNQLAHEVGARVKEAGGSYPSILDFGSAVSVGLTVGHAQDVWHVGAVQLFNVGPEWDIVVGHLQFLQQLDGAVDFEGALQPGLRPSLPSTDTPVFFRLHTVRRAHELKHKV